MSFRPTAKTGSTGRPEFSGSDFGLRLRSGDGGVGRPAAERRRVGYTGVVQSWDCTALSFFRIRCANSASAPFFPPLVKGGAGGVGR